MDDEADLRIEPSAITSSKGLSEDNDNFASLKQSHTPSVTDRIEKS